MATSIIGAVSFAILTLAVGCVTLSLIYGGVPRGALEAIGLSMVLGAGAMSLILFAASLAGLAPSRALLAGVACVAIGAAGTAWRLKRLIRLTWRWESLQRGDWITAICLAIMAYLFAAVTLHALALPLYEWDSFAIWGLKAKVLAHESLKAKLEYFEDRSLSYSHLDYPLLLPLLLSGAYGAIGRVDDQWGKLILPLLYGAFGATMFTALRWKLSRPRAALLTVLMMALPPCVRWAGAGNADLALTLFYGASIFYLAKWLQGNDSADLGMVALLSAFAAFSKNEGLGLAILNAICLALFSPLRQWRARIAKVLLAGAVALALLAPWLLWRRYLPQTHEDYGARITLSNFVSNLPRLGTVMRAFAVQVINLKLWGGLWLLLILAGAFGWKAFRERYVLALWALLAAHLGMYATVYTVTPWDMTELLNVSLDRVLFHVTPAAILLIGYHWEIENRGREKIGKKW